ncbi:MAG TPA: sugar transferase [Acetomicrobium sp.]|nr:sugar transferase [Acetomicrobium sp.]
MKERAIKMPREADVKLQSYNIRKKGGFYRRYFKRPLDFVLSLTAIIILSPILLFIALLVRIKLGSPVIFKQQRPGMDELNIKRTFLWVLSR